MALAQDRNFRRLSDANPPPSNVSHRRPPATGEAIDLCRRLSGEYGISATSGLIEICEQTASAPEIAVAVLGRFKAGKSSFLNHLIGRELLPVGVVPVTAIVTQIGYGPVECAEVHYLDGRVRAVELSSIREYVTERDNPENVKQVERLSVDLPQLERFEGLRFVDTPGLESALEHNTRASLDWLPNVGLALVAVSVDPPLSGRDIELIKTLLRFTPSVSVLVTKADLLSDRDREEVLEYIGAQLARSAGAGARILPYSDRPGFERFKAEVERVLIEDTLGSFNEQRGAILKRKVETLVEECEAFLRLALKSAETAESERSELARVASEERAAAADAKAQFRLTVQHASATSRPRFAAMLEKHQPEMEQRFRESLADEFPAWTASLAKMMTSYQEWLESRLRSELGELQAQLEPEFRKPLWKTTRQISRALQAYRDRLSAQTERAFGIPLHTTETEIEAAPPKSPDIRVGQVFDRNWELLSPVLPVSLIKGIVYAHFRRKLPFMIYKNLSRLATQWEDVVNKALEDLRREAERRLDSLVATVERLLATNPGGAARLREDLRQLGEMKERLKGAGGPGYGD